MDKKVTVLIAPLDWGLGHSTRCLPIVKAFMQLECNVLLACNSKQKEIFADECPGITIIPLDGYHLSYGKSRIGTILSIIGQLPKILTKIKQEKTWLDTMVDTLNPDIIISDNRFGFWHARVRSIFITHQLHIRTGLGRLANWMVRLWNYRQINHFSECWVPDFDDTHALAGSLAHPPNMPDIPVKYIGPLSRFEACGPPAERIPLLIILSGPEPQRSIFESLLLKQLQGIKQRTILVRGVPETEQLPHTNDEVRVLNFAGKKKLNQLICRADLVCCRAGYTSIMDLIKLRKKCILIPTPGQAEQEYLGQFMHQRQLAYVITQRKFNLPLALAAAHQFPFQHLKIDMDQYLQVIGKLVADCRKRP